MFETVLLSVAKNESLCRKISPLFLAKETTTGIDKRNLTTRMSPMRFTACRNRSRRLRFENAGRDELRKRITDMSAFLQRAHRHYGI